MATLDTDSPILTAIIWAFAGAGWGLWNYIKKQIDPEKPAESFDPVYAGSTVGLYFLSGFALGIMGDELTVENLEYIALFIGPYADDLMNNTLGTRLKPQPSN